MPYGEEGTQEESAGYAEDSGGMDLESDAEGDSAYGDGQSRDWMEIESGPGSADSPFEGGDPPSQDSEREIKLDLGKIGILFELASITSEDELRDFLGLDPSLIESSS